MEERERPFELRIPSEQRGAGAGVRKAGALVSACLRKSTTCRFANEKRRRNSKQCGARAQLGSPTRKWPVLPRWGPSMGGNDAADSTTGAVMAMGRSTIVLLDRPPPGQRSQSPSRRLLATDRLAARWNAMPRAYSWTNVTTETDADVLSPYTSEEDEEEMPQMSDADDVENNKQMEELNDEDDDEEEVEEPWEVADIEDELRRFEMKMNTQHQRQQEAAQTHPSPASMRDETPVNNQESTTQRVQEHRLEAKIKAIAQYIKTMSSSMRRLPRQRRRRSRREMALSQFPMHRSAPDVLGHARSVTPVRLSSSNMVNVKTTLVSHMECDMECADVDEQQVVRVRKRGRRCGQFFTLNELTLLCRQCDVPTKNINEVVSVVAATFGTHMFDVILVEELAAGNIVLLMGTLVFAVMDREEQWLDMVRLRAFFRHVQTRYHAENPFHNACHAADVMHSLFVLFCNTHLGRKISPTNQIGALLAAVMHDIEHVGLTNDFLIKTNHAIAQRYASKAPLEEMHASIATELMERADFALMGKMTCVQRSQVLRIVREVILATALCYQRGMLAEMNNLSALDWGVEHDNNQCSEGETDSSEDDDEAPHVHLPFAMQLLVLRCATHVSDIGQTMKTFSVHTKWVDRLNREHYRQGELDMANSLGVSPPFCFEDRFPELAFLKCQVGFLKNVALPAVETLHRVPWMNVQHLVEGIYANIAEWETRLREKEASVTTVPLVAPVPPCSQLPTP